MYNNESSPQGKKGLLQDPSVFFKSGSPLSQYEYDRRMFTLSSVLRSFSLFPLIYMDISISVLEKGQGQNKMNQKFGVVKILRQILREKIHETFTTSLIENII